MPKSNDSKLIDEIALVLYPWWNGKRSTYSPHLLPKMVADLQASLRLADKDNEDLQLKLTGCREDLETELNNSAFLRSELTKAEHDRTVADISHETMRIAMQMLCDSLAKVRGPNA